MWTLRLNRNHRDLNLLKPGLAKHLMQLDFAEPKPKIGVKLAGLFKIVSQ